MLEIQAIGNLGKDAEQKTIGGTPYASFSIAITRRVDGKEKTTWLKVMKSDKEGKLTAYLTKGTKVWVRGLPNFSAYVSKNTGDAIPDTTIWANSIEFCSSKEQNKQPENQGSGMDNFSEYQQQQEKEDDLPF